MSEEAITPHIICVTLNPAIDRTIEVHRLELGQHAKGRLVSRHPAGKAVNVARVLQHLGQPCLLTGFVGKGERSMFERSFDTKTVRTQFFGLDIVTRENVTLMDLETGVETHVRDEGAEIREEDQKRLMRKLKILAKPEVWMVFAGSLPRGFTPERFGEMLGAVARQGAKIVLDSAEGAPAVLRKLPVWLIKPNREELAAMAGSAVGSEAELVSAARSLRDAADIVLVSSGERGCYLVEGETVLHAHMRKMPRKVTNTVGCGDALLAGFLRAKARNLESRQSLQLAVATATSASFQVHSGQIDAEEAGRLVEQVAVEAVAEGKK